MWRWWFCGGERWLCRQWWGGGWFLLSCRVWYGMVWFEVDMYMERSMCEGPKWKDVSGSLPVD